jgi:poly(3-hydroxybutyrate) depolymerase
MLYLLHEASHLTLAPARTLASIARLACENPFNPVAYTAGGRALAASCELFERTTRAYPKPAFNLPVSERIVWENPFCRVIAFGESKHQPSVLIVAPMSGHHATLLRGTVAAFLEDHQVFITDWSDAKQVPLAEGQFDLSDYIDYCIAIFESLGPDLHVVAVCQPVVPVLAAIALMEAEDHPLVPRSATLLSGPVDTRYSPTAVNRFIQTRDIDWFERNCIHLVPPPYPGSGRGVYPGFMQLCGFMAMNSDRHISAHWEMFSHLVDGDGDSAERHREFYDEYLAVVDLSAEFYLQTLETVFIDHLLPRNRMRHRGKPVDLNEIRRCGLMTVEGDNDDITGRGQTLAALELTPNLSTRKKEHYVQTGVGHFGVFNGSRFRTQVAPCIKAFVRKNA